MVGEIVLYKRWMLRAGVRLDDVATLVRTHVVPRYRELSTHVVIELQAADETTVLAVQRWSSRTALDAAFTSAEFGAWWASYLPTLQAWDELVVFDAEWTGDVLT